MSKRSSLKCPECGEVDRIVFAQKRWEYATAARINGKIVEVGEPDSGDTEGDRILECSGCGKSWDDVPALEAAIRG